MNKTDVKVDSIFDKLDKIHNNIDDTNIKDLIDEVVGDIDEVIYNLKYEIEQKDSEIDILKEKMFDLKWYRF